MDNLQYLVRAATTSMHVDKKTRQVTEYGRTGWVTLDSTDTHAAAICLSDHPAQSFTQNEARAVIKLASMRGLRVRVFCLTPVDI